MSGFTPTPDFIREQFNDYVHEEVFGLAQRPAVRPVLVLLGGQPAAGKSVAQTQVEARSPEAHLVAITGDAFRKYHPQFDELTEHDPLRMPNVTSSVSGPLVRECLDHAKEQGYSVLLEGTFVNEEMVLSTAEEFAQAGYDVQVCAVAVSEDVSRLSAEERYLSQVDIDPGNARWTPPTAHDLAVVNSPGTVAALEASSYVQRVEVWTREDRIYVNERGADGQWGWEPGAAQAMLDERARPIGNPEEWLRLYEKNAGRAESHQVHHGPGSKAEPYLGDDRVFGAWERISRSAEGVVSVAVPDPQDPRRAELNERIEAHAQQIKAARGLDLGAGISADRQSAESQEGGRARSSSAGATSDIDELSVARAAFPGSARDAVSAPRDSTTELRSRLRGDQELGQGMQR